MSTNTFERAKEDCLQSWPTMRALSRSAMNVESPPAHRLNIAARYVGYLPPQAYPSYEPHRKPSDVDKLALEEALAWLSVERTSDEVIEQLINAHVGFHEPKFADRFWS